MDLVVNQTTYKILIFHKMPEVKFKGSILTKKGHFDYKTGIFSSVQRSYFSQCSSDRFRNFRKYRTALNVNEKTLGLIHNILWTIYKIISIDNRNCL